MGAPITDIVRKHTISRLQPHHRAMARAMAQGARPTDLVAEFGVTPAWVTQIVNSPLFKAEVTRLTGDIEQRQAASQRQINAELDLLLERSVEIIAQELHSQKPSARRTDAAFKILDRRGYHPKNDQANEDNRQFNFITLTPEPGEDPAEAMKRVNAVVREMRRTNEHELQDLYNDSGESDEAVWPCGAYELERTAAEIPGQQVYRLQLVDEQTHSEARPGV